jgi:hypothetical protein
MCFVVSSSSSGGGMQLAVWLLQMWMSILLADIKSYQTSSIQLGNVS